MTKLKDPKKMTRITISIDPEEYQAVEQMAEKDERSAAWVIRKAIREFLERNNQQVQLREALYNLKVPAGNFVRRFYHVGMWLNVCRRDGRCKRQNYIL
jgi:predicted transcriptional regulator